MAEAHTNKSSGGRLKLGGSKRSRVPAQIAALDIDGALVRVAVGTRRGERVEFTRLAVAALPLGDDADRTDPAVMGAAIKAALETLRLKPALVAMAVPRREAILRTVSLPDVADDRELASMVQLQVGRDLPYRKEDAVIDFEPRRGEAAAPAAAQEGDASPPSAPKIEALVAIAQTDVVAYYRKTCEAAGLKLGTLTFAPFANVRCLAASGAVAREETVALVTVRSTEVTVDVARSGKLLFSRDATLAEEHHAPAEDETTPVVAPAAAQLDDPAAAPAPVANGQPTVVERITIEVVRSLHAFSGMIPGSAVSKIIVAGGSGHEPEVVQTIEKRLNVPATALDLASPFDVAASVREFAPGSVSAMGAVIAATDPAGLPFDFLAPKRPAVQRDMRRVRLLAAAAAIVLLLVGAAGVRGYLMKKRVRAQQAIQQEITNLQKNQPLYRRTRSQAAAIQEWQKEGRNWLDHYAYLTAILPGTEEIYITSLSVGSAGTIHLSVQARSGEVIAKLDKQLRDSGYEVKPQAITPGVDRYGYNFRSSVDLIVPPKMKIDLTKTKAPPPRPSDDISLNALGKPGAGSSPSVNVYGGGQ